jgi:hypothetical protein
MVIDLALGYRWFTARWQDGTTIRMSGFGDVRLGMGATWRVAPNIVLTPMVSVFTGAFTSRTLDGQTMGGATSTYAGGAFTLAGHFELL